VTSTMGTQAKVNQHLIDGDLSDDEITHFMQHRFGK
jgi:hypothetical protein